MTSALSLSNNLSFHFSLTPKLQDVQKIYVPPVLKRFKRSKNILHPLINKLLVCKIHKFNIELYSTAMQI